MRRAGNDFEVEWQVSPAAVGERFERRASLTDEGVKLADDLANGTGTGARDKRPLGPRQLSVLLELRQAPEPVATARLADRYGSSPMPGLVRRGLVRLETVRADRRPRDGRAAPVRGALPAAASLTAEQQAVASRLTELVETRASSDAAARGRDGERQDRGLRRGHRCRTRRRARRARAGARDRARDAAARAAAPRPGRRGRRCSTARCPTASVPTSGDASEQAR